MDVGGSEPCPCRIKKGPQESNSVLGQEKENAGRFLVRVPTPLFPLLSSQSILQAEVPHLVPDKIRVGNSLMYYLLRVAKFTLAKGSKGSGLHFVGGDLLQSANN